MLARLPSPLKRVLRGAVLAVRFGGRGLECPSCGKQFRRFAPYNGVSGMACPNCGSRQRHRMLTLYLRNQVGVGATPCRLLHVAPETGLRRQLEQATNLDYVTADLMRTDVDVRVDLLALPFSDDSFDVVVCSHVLEHVPDDRAAMRELARVTRPKGRLLVMVPVDFERAATYEDSAITTPAGRLAAFGQSDHLRLFGRDVADRLAEHVERVDEVDYALDLGPEAAARLAARPGVDVIYDCRPN
ncbi:MAG: methyltransferase domain-containing protein [Microthrixaceae bacterium]